MIQPLRWLFLSLFIALLRSTTPLLAQTITITTQPLSVTSVCPGSTFDVPFTISGLEGHLFQVTVQLSDGGDYKNLLTSAFSYGSNSFVVTATIPANQAPGTAYRVRVSGANFTATGSPSPTLLTVKTKPAPPSAQSPQYDCQYRPATANANTYLPYSTIYLKNLTPRSTVNFYDENGNPVAFTPGSIPQDSTFRNFTSPAYINANPSIKNYTATQVVNGCESEKTPVQLIILPKPATGPTVNTTESVTVSGIYGPFTIGRVKLCQGSKAVTFANLPITPPSGYSVGYCDVTTNGAIGGYGGCSTAITGSTTIETSVVGRRIFRLSSVPNDSKAGCTNNSTSDTYIVVDVFATPTKPAATTSTITYCQSQTASPLSASLTDNNATLVWYGTNATGGTGSTVATVPSTANAGTFMYYVAQRLNDCESERTAITVEVKAGAPVPTVANVAVCQNAPTPTLQVNGQNLLWYTSSTGGTGSTATPVINTAQTSQTTYYVTQTINGCESLRAAVSVAISAIPGAPVVATTGPAYCQFAQAAPLIAQGQNLLWYRESSGGTGAANVTPGTGTAGSFTYYASQTINGCEGSRSAVTVKVNEAPSGVTVLGDANARIFCGSDKNARLIVVSKANYTFSARVLYKDYRGTILRDTLYQQTLTKDTLSLSGAFLPTDSSGTITYTLVNKDNNGCVSRPVSLTVLIKPVPAAPETSAISVCQNTAGQNLSAKGQNLLWYAAQTGGTGTTTAPTLNTGQPGTSTYYVSQTIDGCESSRNALSVTVKPQPGAPGVAATSVCQFASPQSASATGQNLKWYNPDGTFSNMAPVPATNQGASFTYAVSQTVDGCESSKATATVNVLVTPAPTVAKTTVEVCQGTVPQPLVAEGTNLRWTDPNGVVSTTAPAPPTTNATTKPEGDVYYVTQTGTNGCESPKVAIRVFVQTVPTLSLSGTTTTNLGLEVPLKLSFTGVGPYRFKLSNGLTGTAVKDTTILVLPTQTTTYQVAEVTNKCGTGSLGAAVVVMVNVPTITTTTLTSTTLCAGTTVTAGFVTNGSFNTGNVFKVQVAPVVTDSTKINFVDITSSIPANGQIIGNIPTTIAGGTYWVRVIATNPKIPINGTISPTVLTIRSLATATLAGTQSIFEGASANLSVSFTGDGPWTFTYRDSTASGLGAVQTVSTNANPHTLSVRPAKTTTYQLLSVSNGCGNGAKAVGTATVTVMPVLGVEDPSLSEALDVFPVPVTSTLTVRINGLRATETATLELTDLTGRTTLQQQSRQSSTSLLLEQHPAGTYLLRVRVGDRTATRRILKL